MALAHARASLFGPECVKRVPFTIIEMALNTLTVMMWSRTLRDIAQSRMICAFTREDSLWHWHICRLGRTEVYSGWNFEERDKFGGLDELLFSTNRLPHISFTDENLQIPEVKCSMRRKRTKNVTS